VGAAYALERRGERGRAVFCQFGEGATSEGEWHEAINFAAVHNLPVVFICENNRWAISTPQDKQMANPDVAARASGYGMASAIVDGFDPIAVYETVRAARDRAAGGGGPTLVEAKCYRFLSHTTDDDDRTYRTREEVDAQRALDPVPRFEQRLIGAGILTGESLATLRREITETVNATTDAVEAEALPTASDLYGNVYAESDDAWT
jgi:2-oxoisovalerate dehydrogenase E1 component alpha subunit